MDLRRFADYDFLFVQGVDIYSLRMISQMKEWDGGVWVDVGISFELYPYDFEAFKGSMLGGERDRSADALLGF